MDEPYYLVDKIWYDNNGYRIINIWDDNDGCHLDIMFEENILSVNLKDIKFESYPSDGFNVYNMALCHMGDVFIINYHDIASIGTKDGQIICWSHTNDIVYVHVNNILFEVSVSGLGQCVMYSKYPLQKVVWADIRKCFVLCSLINFEIVDVRKIIMQYYLLLFNNNNPSHKLFWFMKKLKFKLQYIHSNWTTNYEIPRIRNSR